MTPPSFLSMLLQSLLFILTTLLWYHYHRRYNDRALHSRDRTSTSTPLPFPIFRPLTKLNSIIYALFSFSLSLYLLLNIILCPTPTPAQDAFVRTLYHYTKLYEYVDVFNVIAIGGTVDRYFGFHHLSTPWLTWVRVLGGGFAGTKEVAGVGAVAGGKVVRLGGGGAGGGGQAWRVLAALNAAHHTVMYPYFAGVTSVRRILPVTGTLQLVVGVGAEVWELLQAWMGGAGIETEERWRCWFSLGLMGCYLVLNTQDLMTRGFWEKKVQKDGRVLAKSE